MRKSKKRIALMAMVSAMMIVSAVPAFAADGKDAGVTVYGAAGDKSDLSGSDKELEVYGKVSTGGDKYCIDIGWEDMKFVYEASDWDPANHEYTGDTGWYRDRAKFLIVNHSNKDVKFKTSLTQNIAQNVLGGTDVKLSLSNDDRIITACPANGIEAEWLTAGDEVGNVQGLQQRDDGAWAYADSIDISGTPVNNVNDFSKIAVMKIAFSKNS